MIKIIQKIKQYFINDYDEEYLEIAEDKYYKVPLRTGELKDYVEPNLYNYKIPYAEQIRLTTPEAFNFHLKAIKTILKTWEQDINDTGIKR